MVGLQHLVTVFPLNMIILPASGPPFGHCFSHIHCHTCIASKPLIYFVFSSNNLLIRMSSQNTKLNLETDCMNLWLPCNHTSVLYFVPGLLWEIITWWVMDFSGLVLCLCKIYYDRNYARYFCCNRNLNEKDKKILQKWFKSGQSICNKETRKYFMPSISSKFDRFQQRFKSLCIGQDGHHTGADWVLKPAVAKILKWPFWPWQYREQSV